jgi:predicted  nucleic acid-binding Zn-ribbon protein
MQELLTALLELQELEIVLEESRIVHGDATLPSAVRVEVRVKALRQAVPPGELRRYDGLRRGGPAVVKEHDGSCGGCHLNVNRGDLNRMLRLEMDWLCPNCGRYLLVTL